MKNFLTILTLITLISISSCRKDFDLVETTGNLVFSKDTVFLDTIFTNISSATYNLKVYNRSDDAISIPEIVLANGTASKYRLSVDGIAGKKFENIEILAKDSIYIFIETTIDIAAHNNPLYTDKIVFNNGTNSQNVDLVTLVQDAVFIYPNKTNSKINTLTLDGKSTDIKGRFLTSSELIFTKEKPYVIYGYAAVPSEKTLIIEAGAKLYFHEESGLLVDKNASLKVNGTLDEKVTFEGDRLEYDFDDTTGQWGTIWLRSGSKNNEILNACIKNSVIGILVDSIAGTNPTLKIKNSEIYNSATFGIYGRKTNIEGENLVIGNTGESSFAGTIGGVYNFIHCTFANYWTKSLRSSSAVYLNNSKSTFDESGNKIIEQTDLNVSFTNCIIEGNNKTELLLNKREGTAFNYLFKNCIIRFDESYENKTELNFEDTTHYQSIILNGNANFKNVNLYNFVIGQNSDALKKGVSTGITIDILGISRVGNIDIGAYQHIIF